MLNSVNALYTSFLFQCRTWRLINEGFFVLQVSCYRSCYFVVGARWLMTSSQFSLQNLSGYIDKIFISHLEVPPDVATRWLW